MVNDGHDERVGGTLRRTSRWTWKSIEASADSIRRLHTMAAAVVGGGICWQAARVLEVAPGERSTTGTAQGPSTTCCPELPGRHRRIYSGLGVDRSAEAF